MLNLLLSQVTELTEQSDYLQLQVDDVLLFKTLPLLVYHILTM